MADQFTSDDEFQDSIIAHFVADPGKFLAYGEVLKASYFQGAQATVVAYGLLDYVKTYNKAPAWPTLRQLALDQNKKLGMSDDAEVLRYIDRLREMDAEDGEYVVTKVVTFARERATINAIKKAIELIREKKTPEDGFVKMFEEALQVGQNLDDLGLIFHMDFGDVIDKVTKADYGTMTGYPQWDRLWRRGWGPGWLIIFVAPPKRYKTAMVMNLALNIISPMQGGDVLYYSCEITQELAFMRGLNNITQKGMSYVYENPEKFKELTATAMVTSAAGTLVIKGYPSGTASIATITNHATLAVQQLGLKNLRAIIIDYADTVLPSGTYEKEYLRQAGIYTEARALGAKFKVPVLMPDRMTKEATDKRVPDMKAFQGAFAKGGIVDAAIGLCIHGDQSVVTNVGHVRIVQIRHKLRSGPVLALSHNFLTGKDEWKPITKWFDNGINESRFIRIKTDSRNPETWCQRSRGAVVTPEHLFFKPDGSSVKAGDLKVGDEIATRGYALSEDQKQVLLGTLMGDSYLTEGGQLRVGHGGRQRYYVLWKQSVFENLRTHFCSRVLKARMYGNTLLRERTAVHLLVWGSSEIARLRNVFYNHKTKRVPSNKILNQMNLLGLAVWFMDDGSIGPINDRINLHTECFTRLDCERLIIWFQEKWDLTGTLTPDNVIRFGAVSARKILNMLSTYICRNPNRNSSGKYQETKLFLCPRTELGKTGLEKSMVTDVSVFPYQKRPCKRRKYDIEVADNHNYYLASGMLVHNCMTDDEYAENIFRSFVFINRHGAAFLHLRGKVDPEVMTIDLGEEIPYEPDEDDDQPRRKRRRFRSGEDMPKIDE